MTPNHSELGRAFNTAIVGSRLDGSTSKSSGVGANSTSVELMNLVESQAYRAILDAIAGHAAASNLSIAVASEEIIRTFRKADALWNEYVYQLGVERLRGSSASPSPPPPTLRS